MVVCPQRNFCYGSILCTCFTSSQGRSEDCPELSSDYYLCCADELDNKKNILALLITRTRAITQNNQFEFYKILIFK